MSFTSKPLLFRSVCEGTIVRQSTKKHVLPLTMKLSKQTTINVEGMSCGHCSNAVKNLIEEVKGVETVNVNLGTNDANVSFDANEIDTKAIIDNINSSDIYKATEK
jgi:copper chaperone CopZ